MHECKSLLVRNGALGICAVVLLLVELASPSAAQSTNASTVIILGSADVDPASIPFLSDDARQSLTGAIADLKSATSVAHVMTTSPNETGWASREADNTTFVNIEDPARQSLETCEYYSKIPCLILSINGHDARDASGGWPLQPRMLTDEPGLFDAMQLPFANPTNRGILQSLPTSGHTQGARHSDIGRGALASGRHGLPAIATAEADRENSFAGQLCVLYAVNDRVVFAR